MKAPKAAQVVGRVEVRGIRVGSERAAVAANKVEVDQAAARADRVEVGRAVAGVRVDRAEVRAAGKKAVKAVVREVPGEASVNPAAEVGKAGRAATGSRLY